MAGSPRVTDRYCFWSVADGPYAAMMRRAIASARAVGVFKDFHVWSDQSIPGAITHRVRNLDKRFYMFKIRLLRERVAALPYEYVVWLDADSWFVRHPGNLLQSLHRAPVHLPLESDMTQARKRQGPYDGCSFAQLAEIMRHKGVLQNSVFASSAAFWIVRREAIEHFAGLASEFWIYCHQKGMAHVRERIALAYAAQMLCGNPYVHTVEEQPDLWATDKVGIFKNKLPRAGGWLHVDPVTGRSFPVNPAIIHAPLSRGRLARASHV